MPALVGGGIWAIMPDLWHILPIYSDVYLSEVHHSFIANIFWFHRVFDLVDTKDSLYFATLALMYLCACTIIHEIVLRKTDDL